MPDHVAHLPAQVGISVLLSLKGRCQAGISEASGFPNRAGPGVSIVESSFHSAARPPNAIITAPGAEADETWDCGILNVCVSMKKAQYTSFLETMCDPDIRDATRAQGHAEARHLGTTTKSYRRRPDGWRTWLSATYHLPQPDIRLNQSLCTTYHP